MRRRGVVQNQGKIFFLNIENIYKERAGVARPSFAPEKYVLFRNLHFCPMEREHEYRILFLKPMHFRAHGILQTFMW